MSHTCACTHVYMYMCVCARVGVCVINENKHPFQDFLYLISHALLIYPSNHHHFFHVRLFLCVIDVTKRGASDHAT